MKVFYTNEAERDLERIASYTLDVWGEAQRDSYLDLLEDTCERILPTRLHLALKAEGYPGVLRWRVESYVVYFRKVRGGVEVIRILHARMLPSRHL